MVQKERSRSKIRVDKVYISRKEAVFFLNQDKEGCNSIVFELGDEPELKQLLLNFFEGDKGFDFHINEKLTNKRCKIDAIMRSF